MLVAGRYFIPESEFDWQFVQSPGPGGQNVNKVATAVRLGFNLRRTAALPLEIRDRFLAKLGDRLNEEGQLAVLSHTSRSQSFNRADALRKLQSILEEALKEPKKRRATRPTRGSIERRLQLKSRNAAVKTDRARKNFDEE